MFSKSEQKKIAKKLVNVSLNIGQKPNPYFEKLSKQKKFKWLHGTFTFAQAKRKSNMSEKRLKAFLQKYQNVRYGPLIVKKGKRYHVKQKIGHILRLIHHPDSKDLALAIRTECWKNGAHAFMGETKNEYGRARYLVTPTDTLREYPLLSKAISETVDFAIHLETRDWGAWSHGISPAKIKASVPASLAAHDIEDRRQVRWLLIGWPFKKRAQELKIPYSKLKRIMKNSIKISFEKDLQQLLKRYYKAFAGAKTIQIVADDGTDLKFSVKGRHFLIDDGITDEADIKRGDVGGNIPCGEVFVAPVENSANGVLVIPRSNVPGQGMAHELKLTFKNGRVVHSTAKKGKDFLKKFIAQNSKDANKIAELGIGCNKGAEFTGGEIIIDEKILGTIHIAIGWNKGYGGKTNASSHLDFIKDLRQRNGKLFVDGKLTINKGKLVR